MNIKVRNSSPLTASRPRLDEQFKLPMLRERLQLK
jgi:hypothetical protein